MVDLPLWCKLACTDVCLHTFSHANIAQQNRTVTITGSVGHAISSSQQLQSMEYCSRKQKVLYGLLAVRNKVHNKGLLSQVKSISCYPNLSTGQTERNANGLFPSMSLTSLQVFLTLPTSCSFVLLHILLGLSLLRYPSMFQLRLLLYGIGSLPDCVFHLLQFLQFAVGLHCT
jgi:hypothetical protein